MLNAENFYLFKFSWKSIRRHAGRSFFIGFSVSLAVMVAVWVVAFFDGMNYQIEKAVVNTNTGYFQIQEPSYASTTDSSSPLEFSPALKQKMSEPPITAFSPELVLDGNISTPDGAAALMVLGIEPRYHQRILPLNEKIIQGSYLSDSDEFGVMIGKELASLFKFQVGDQLVLNYQDKNGELRSEILNIQGIYHYNSQGFEKRFVYINQNTWQKLFLNEPTNKILFNRITVLTPSLKSQPLLEQQLEGSHLQLKSWKQLNPEMAVVLEFHDGMIKFFFLIIGVTITMTILTPVRMLWQERFSEMKMMNTIGITVKKFWKLGVYEVIIMIMLSGIGSCLLLVMIIGYQSYYGVDFRFLGDGIPIERAGIKLPGIIYPRLSVDQLIITFIFVLLILSFSYLWSIQRTLKKLKASA